MCQPGRPLPQGESQPGSSADGELPEDEIAGVFLVRLDGDARAGLLLIEIAAGELAVFAPRGVEKDFAIGVVGVAFCDQRFDDCDHPGDIIRRPRLMRRLKASQRLHILMKLVGRLFGDLADRLVQRQVGKIAQGPRVDLVVHVGDVAHIGDVFRAIEMAQEAEEDVEDDDRACIADMGEVVDRRAAGVEAHIVLVDGGEDFLRAGERVVELQF